MEATIRQAITEAIAALGVGEVDFVVEHPADLSHGDYASNVAMVLAKQLGKSPREVAEELVAVLHDTIADVERIEIAGPGFINFHLQRDWFVEQTKRVLKAKEAWGQNDEWKDKVVLVEYTDPNPFKELHIGHVVPNALGESLARLSMAAGAITKRVTFQGDVGMHVAKAIYGLQQLGASAEEGFDAATLGKAYATGATAFEEREDVAVDIKALNKVIYERSDDSVNELYDYGKQVSLDYFERGYSILGSAFDHNFFESVTGPTGLAKVREHIGDVFSESDGAVIFKGEDYGLHTRVFINAEGLPTYEAKDVGLIIEKDKWSREVIGRPFDIAITVTGTEQEQYFKVTTKASELIQPDVAGKVELVPNGMLRLAEGKMSSRTGQVVRALDLISDVQQAALERMHADEVEDAEAVAQKIAVAAIKYTILKIAAGKDIVFDLKQSISFEGDSGPYLQYTYARINSVLEKAAAAGVESAVAVTPETPYELEKLLYQYEEVVKEALHERAPHKVVHYLTELAGEYNSFYATEKIADPTDEFAPYKVALSQAVAQTLKNGLWVLGIEAVEKM